MKFSFIDHNVSTTMNVFIVIANIINLVYNIPQVVKTWKSKSTNDFSGWFLSLRFIGNTIWIAYAIELDSLLMLINNVVTVLASGIIGGIMLNNMYRTYKLKQYNILNNPDDVDDDIANYKINIVSIEHNNKNEDMEEITLT
jgi:MtN3 and saliva related transmembrane protein